jgi:predicted nucleic acid-binding protein
VRIYFDACCLNRLTDDQSQSRVRDETESVETIMRRVREHSAIWISSTILSVEISRNPDTERRRDAEMLLSFANDVVVPTAETAGRASRIEELGFSPFDAMHLACAEQGHVELFLTTDDALLRRARRNADMIHVRVENPVSWCKEAQL